MALTTAEVMAVSFLGAGLVRDGQRVRRRWERDAGDSVDNFVIQIVAPDATALNIAIREMRPSEAWWRMVGSEVYRSALGGSEYSRDYADWLLPHLKLSAITDASWLSFWVLDVQGDSVRDDQIMGICDYLQARRGVSLGNSGDAVHTRWIRDADLFTTADRGFYKLLVELKTLLGWACAEIRLFDRGASNPVTELDTVTRGQ